MMSIQIETATFDRLQGIAKPLVDTFDTVINRLVDVYEQANGGAASTRAPAMNPASAPNLSYTTIESVVLDGHHWPKGQCYWNLVLLAIILEAHKAGLTNAEIEKLIVVNHVVGMRTDNGYKYLKEVDLSVQGQDANGAWKCTYNVAQAAKIPLEVKFRWQENPKAAAPGKPGVFSLKWN